MSQKQDKRLRRTIRKNKTRIIKEFVELMKRSDLRIRIKIAYSILIKRGIEDDKR